MSDLVFIQHSRFGRTIFALRGDMLEITSHMFGQKSTALIPVRTLASDYELGARGLTPLVVIPALLAMGCFVGSYLLISRSPLPTMLGWYPAMAGLVFAAVSVQFMRRVEYFIFHDQWNRDRFSIVREREQAEECDAFVRELLDRIERPETGSAADAPPAEPAPPVSAVRVSDTPEAGLLKGSRWKLSIVAGAVSTVFPVATYEFVSSPEALAIVLLCSTVGFIGGGFSFADREPRRIWALLGILLSVVPLFYTY